MISAPVGKADHEGNSAEQTPAQRAIEAQGGELTELIRLAMESGCPVWLRATGDSMAPAIRNGTSVRLYPARGRRVRRGDIVLAQFAGGKLVLHRVESVQDGSIVLRGDNHVRPDPAISAMSLLGIVDRVEVDGEMRDVRQLPGPGLRIWWRRLVRPARDRVRSWRAALSSG